MQRSIPYIYYLALNWILTSFPMPSKRSKQQGNNLHFALRAQELYEARHSYFMYTHIIELIYPAIEPIDETYCIISRSHIWLHIYSAGPNGELLIVPLLICSRLYYALSTAHCIACLDVGIQAKVSILTICPSGLRALQSKNWLRRTTQKVPSIGL